MTTSFNPETKIWSGPYQPPILNPEASFGQSVLAVMSLNPTKVIQIDADTGHSMTNGEMRLRAIRAAQNLAELGLRKGDMVAMACANSDGVASMVLALLFNGMPVHMLAPNYGVDDLRHMMAITQPKLIFCDESNYDSVAEAAEQAVKNQPLVYAFECDLGGIKKAEDLFKETKHEVEFSAPYLGDSSKLLGIVLCTSGTTGLPKAVCLSHAHLIAIFSRSIGSHGLELIFNFSPLYWASGLYTLMMSLLNGTTRLITRKPFGEDLCFDLLEQFHVDGIFTSPSSANLLLQHPRIADVNWANIKLWFFGGSPLSDKIRNSIAALLPNGKTGNGYGSSEVGTFTFDATMQKPNSVGMLLPNIRAKIIDENENALGKGSQGELLVKFSEKFLGYYNDPDATAQSFNEDGWFKTGDVAYFDDDGFLFLVDRKKDLLKYRGHQIAPRDLEAIIEKMPGVGKVCVVGIPDEDGASELAAAVIVKTKMVALSEQDVLKEVNEVVADYKKLRGGVFFVDEFPTTVTGKPMRRVLRDIVIKRMKSKQ
uniref:Putative acyl-coa synthetase n=1 Tax=Culex tarsalis TaxID=7177 RepID=A0A1Q3EVD5_CULTA